MWEASGTVRSEASRGIYPTTELNAWSEKGHVR